MKYLFSFLFCFCLYVSQAQTEQPQLPDFDQIDLDMNFDQLFGMLDSLDLGELGLGQLDLNGLGNINELFSQQFGNLSEDKELLNQLLQQGLKTFQQMDMTEMQGLMDNFMKDFEGLNFEENFDLEELEKIVDDHAAKRKKI